MRASFQLYILFSLILTLLTMNIEIHHDEIKTNDKSLSNQFIPQNYKDQSYKYLPDGFVYLSDVDPTIINNLRYLTYQNFIGQPMIGYYANRAIMTKQAAESLKQANEQFGRDGYRIVVYDSYRPQKTVNMFIQWSMDGKPDLQKEKYSPLIDKSESFEKGYIAKKSGHTRGSTLDMSIIKIRTPLKQVELRLRELQDGRLIFLLDDNTLDMGSSFDLSDEASHIYSQLLPKQYIQRRRYLIAVMKKHGFRVLNEEWWHFTLQSQPFPETYFDFDVR